MGRDMNPFPLIGAVFGGLVGTTIWIIAMTATGDGWGGLALLTGAGCAAGAILAASRPNYAIPVALIALAFCLLAKGVGVILASAFQRQAHVASLSFDEADHEKFMDEALEYASVPPSDLDNFIIGRRHFDADMDGNASAEEREHFRNFWAPRLSEWAADPPALIDWAPQLRAEYAEVMQVETDFGQTASMLFGPLALMAMVLAIGGTYLAVLHISTPDAALLDRDDKVVPGIFDLNADIGTRINIQMAAPGEKATRSQQTRITDRVKRATAGRPTGQVLRPPPPKNELRDQPPGMK